MPGEKAEASPNWKGDNATYNVIHRWLKNNYGSASKCERAKCLGISKQYDYALIKGKTHSHNIDNYIMLCRSCHMKYDMNEAKRDHVRELALLRKRTSFGRFAKENS